jgi:hypothetical protein
MSEEQKKQLEQQLWNIANSHIGNWDLSSVTSMSSMFVDATWFNQDLTQWCVSNFSLIPTEFSYNSRLSPANHPVWGTCP